MNVITSLTKKIFKKVSYHGPGNSTGLCVIRNGVETHFIFLIIDIHFLQLKDLVVKHTAKTSYGTNLCHHKAFDILLILALHNFPQRIYAIQCHTSLC